MISPSGPVRDLNGNVITDTGRRHRLPRLRRADRRQRARLHPGPADARHPGHLHLPVRPARQLVHRRRHGFGHAHLREPAALGERGVRHVLQGPRRGRDHQGQHVVRDHRRRGRPLRRLRPDARRLQRGDDPLLLRQGRRGGRQPDWDAGRQGRQHGIRRGGRLRARRLRARAAVRDRCRRPDDGAHGGRAHRGRPGHRADGQADPLPGRPGGDGPAAHDHRRPEAHRHVHAVRQPGLLAEQRVRQLRKLVRQRAERAGRMEPRRRVARRSTRPGSAWSGPAWWRRGQQRDLVRPHRHPADDDGAAGLTDDYTPDGVVLGDVIESDGAAAGHADQLPDAEQARAGSTPSSRRRSASSAGPR